mmetsp:Transcript_47593/g.113114  ORF Transcript_47593/g.113114 Transcript_47593/m.113114 type:complete len:106 (-) Transcript_47593:121-438(-)
MARWWFPASGWLAVLNALPRERRCCPARRTRSLAAAPRLERGATLNAAAGATPIPPSATLSAKPCVEMDAVATTGCRSAGSDTSSMRARSSLRECRLSQAYSVQG